MSSVVQGVRCEVLVAGSKCIDCCGSGTMLVIYSIMARMFCTFVRVRFFPGYF